MGASHPWGWNSLFDGDHAHPSPKNHRRAKPPDGFTSIQCRRLQYVFITPERFEFKAWEWSSLFSPAAICRVLCPAVLSSSILHSPIGNLTTSESHSRCKSTATTGSKMNLVRALISAAEKSLTDGNPHLPLTNSLATGHSCVILTPHCIISASTPVTSLRTARHQANTVCAATLYEEPPGLGHVLTSSQSTTHQNFGFIC